MAINRGKKFEQKIKEAFEKVENVSIDRVHDQTTHYKGSKNICDFIVYKYPNQYYIECKSVHGNILSFSNITENQWNGLLEKQKIYGVKAGIICWFVDKDITYWYSIRYLNWKKKAGAKSIRFDVKYTEPFKYHDIIEIKGKKKRVFFEYDMKSFLGGDK